MTDSFIVRITETTTASGSIDFAVASDTPELAAAQIFVAYQTARAAGNAVLVMPDGQREVLECDKAVVSDVRFDLIDANGTVVRQITHGHVRRSLI
jgi:hypothetical protein